MARRWLCPKCGSGVHGPERPRRDDVRRYCLACSEETGWLVERSAPALERRREAALTRRRAKREVTRARERARFTHDGTPEGLDLRTELKRLCRLAGKLRGRKLRPPAEFTVWRRKAWRHTTGRANGRRIHLTLPVDCSRGRACAVLTHEVAHHAGFMDHGPRFRAFEVDLARAAYGVDADAALNQSAYRSVDLVGRLIDEAATPTDQGGLQ